MDDKTFKGLQIERLKAVPAERLMILAQIHDERIYQERRSEGVDVFDGEFDSKNTANDWVSYIVRYLANSCGFGVTPKEFRTAMLKVAALGVAAVEAVDENRRLPPRHYD